MGLTLVAQVAGPGRRGSVEGREEEGMALNRFLVFVLGLLVAVGPVAASVAADEHDEGPPGDKQASLIDADGDEVGVVHIVAPSGGGTLVSAFVWDVEPGFHGLHIHAGADCTDEDGEPDFGRAGGHLGHDDPDDTPHGTHAGDLPPLYVTGDGTGTYSALTWRVAIEELEDRTFIVHADPDNLGHVPERYQSDDADTPGPDEATRTTGDAGDRVACGEVQDGVPDVPDLPAETARAHAELVATNGERVGFAHFVELAGGTVVVSHDLHDVDPGFRGFHIHEGERCVDDDGDPDFGLAGGHYDPGDGDHGQHAGDLPAALVGDTGVTEIPAQGRGLHRTDRFASPTSWDAPSLCTPTLTTWRMSPPATSRRTPTTPDPTRRPWPPATPAPATPAG